jgi:hypothetical protein
MPGQGAFWKLLRSIIEAGLHPEQHARFFTGARLRASSF